MDTSSGKQLIPEIGARVKSALAEGGMSQNEFARQAGVAQSYVSAVCRGKVLASVPLLRGIRSILGISLDWLLLGVGEMRTGAYSAAWTPEHAGLSESPPPHYGPPASDPYPERDRALHDLLHEVLQRKPRARGRIEGWLEGVGGEGRAAAPESRKRTA